MRARKRDDHPCRGCKYWRKVAESSGPGSLKCCNYMYDTGRSRFRDGTMEGCSVRDEVRGGGKDENH